MSAGSISLESAIRTCKVNTAYAQKIESDRFLNSSNLLCPVWNGLNSKGQSVCPDSFMTKSAGCNSAEDRVVVENNVARPQYMEYITLNVQGIDGNIYSGGNADSQLRAKDVESFNNHTGNFGEQFGSQVRTGCGINAYQQAMAQQNTAQRGSQALQEGFRAHQYRQDSGF